MIEKELVYKYPSSLVPLRDDSKANDLHLFQDFLYMIKLHSSAYNAPFVRHLPFPVSIP